MLVKIRKYRIKKLIKNSEKIFKEENLEKKINDFCLLQFLCKVDNI